MPNKSKLRVKHEHSHNPAEQVKRILTDSSPFEVTEAYKSLRTNILFTMPATENGKVILITSASPGEGKTTTSTNLSITFAQLGAKVILIDADLRASRLIRYLGLRHSDGLSNLLCGLSTFEKAVLKDVRPNLDVLCAGKTPPNPAELLASPSFTALIDGLRERYDYIIIDSPPVAAITDAAIMTKSCDGAIVVIHEEQTTYDWLDDAVDALRRTGVHILGLINVGIQHAKGSYGYGYGYGYGHNRYRDYAAAAAAAKSSEDEKTETSR